MNIYGLQKLTLLDFPEHTACTVFFGGCDLRCPFCHNFPLVDGSAKPVMAEEVFLDFLQKRVGLLDGVVLSGGEPLLSSELPELLSKIREAGFLVKIDTNGLHPAQLEEILDAGLADYVAMDIKNSLEKYMLTAGVPSIDHSMILQSIQMIMEKARDYEFRTTVVKEFHEPEDFHEIGKMIRGAKRYFLQAFTMRDTVPGPALHTPEKELLLEYAAIAEGYVEHVAVRGVE